MIHLDFYQEAQNSLDQLLKFDNGAPGPQTLSIEECALPLTPRPNNCVTSEATLAFPSLTAPPTQEGQKDPVLELSLLRIEQEQKLQLLWRTLGLIEDKGAELAEGGKRGRGRRKVIRKAQKQ